MLISLMDFTRRDFLGAILTLPSAFKNTAFPETMATLAVNPINAVSRTIQPVFVSGPPLWQHLKLLTSDGPMIPIEENYLNYVVATRETQIGATVHIWADRVRLGHLFANKTPVNLGGWNPAERAHLHDLIYNQPEGEVTLMRLTEDILRRLKPTHKEIDQAFETILNPYRHSSFDLFFFHDYLVGTPFRSFHEYKTFCSKETLYINNFRAHALSELQRVISMPQSEYDARNQQLGSEAEKIDLILKRCFAVSVYQLTNGRQGGFGQDSTSWREYLEEQHNEHSGSWSRNF